jgi:tetratricopeptide (TPR) repeat protein
MSDARALFARAEQAFVGGRLDEAWRDLTDIRRSAGEHPQVLHLLALVEKKRGNAAQARDAFRAAHALDPDDPQLAANYANLLGELGESEQALALFDTVLAANPAFVAARYNRALLLQKLGRLDAALADLDGLLAGNQPDARVHSARGIALRLLDRTDEAAAAFDAALQLDPNRLAALHGRARIAMERGEAGAADLYIRALQQKPGDLELVLGLAEALEAEGDPLGLSALTETLGHHPGWVAGHETLARMRSESGHADAFADHYLPALKSQPDNRALHLSYWQSLARGERYGEALRALRDARRTLADDHAMRLTEATLASESGDPEAALALLGALDGADDPEIAFVAGRAALRSGDTERARTLFESYVQSLPDSVSGWAHLELVWRLADDPRHAWLSGQDGLFGARPIGLSMDELADLADRLRSFHITRAHPIGQSLRGGTQTRGRLFLRADPAIARLHDAILAAVHDHLRALPPHDPTHPLLRHRGAAVAIGGSWSIRLGSQGFHVNHIHPEGILSSACYISLPETLGGDESRDGWLELGRPPAELGLALEPLATIRPEPGLLALFPSYLFHGTRPFSDGERLTVAFDVVRR